MIKLRLVGVFFLMVFTPLLFAAKSSPVGMLNKTALEIISALKENRDDMKNDHRALYKIVSKSLLPHLDLNGMARSVLGRQVWRNASSKNKAAFMDAFGQLVIRTYASPLMQYTDEKVKFVRQRGPQHLVGRFTRVHSTITRSNGQKIKMTYSCVWLKDRWKIYDLSIEGVSLLESFRTQFEQALENESLEKLTSKIESKNRAAGG